MNDKDEEYSFNNIYDSFVDHYRRMSNNENLGLNTYYEQDWPSPCIDVDASTKTGDLIYWQPYKRSYDDNIKGNYLSNIESALEISIPLELQSYYCRYFSHDLNATAEQGPLVLLQAYNDLDFERFQKNLIAHVMMKRRLKQTETMFFALTDEDDFVLSVLISTGAVVLEKVGHEPQQEIAPNLADFISTLVPAPQLVVL